MTKKICKECRSKFQAYQPDDDICDNCVIDYGQTSLAEDEGYEYLSTRPFSFKGTLQGQIVTQQRGY